MPCENHDEIQSLDLSKKTELDLFLETMEDIPKDWELNKETIVDEEHRDFDYEAELNNIVNEKIDLAVSTGRANPNARSKQDGLNKQKTAFYKVRYVYANDNFLKNESGTTRDFCKHMMNNEYTSLFTREDITAMSTANPEFGTYNIFRYKGSYNCRHYWLRRLYVLKKAPREVTIDGKVYKAHKAVLNLIDGLVLQLELLEKLNRKLRKKIGI